jgi:hypothetical protein
MGRAKFQTPGANNNIPLVAALAGGIILLGFLYQSKNSEVTKASKAKS